MSALALPLGVVLVLHVALLVVVSVRSARHVTTVADFLVAGRRLGLGLSVGTLLATWYGAGTVLAASDEVRRVGLSGAVLDPLGAGLCLLLAGLFLAAPLRRLELDTLGDLYRVRFGPRAEVVAALLLTPTYFGWIAAQLVALSSVLDVTLGLPTPIGILVVAAVGLVTALFGGMWSVTLTDALHMAIVIVGLTMLAGASLDALTADTEDTLFALGDALPAAHASLVGDGDGVAPWLIFSGVLAAGALGNLPGQDLFQRVFSARDEKTAVRACLVSGVLYLVIGTLPVVIGLAARALGGDESESLPALAARLLPPAFYVVLVVAIVSAVISTLNSALLSPAALLSQNVVSRLVPSLAGSMRALRCTVVVVTLASVALAFVGESAYALLESAYELPLAALLVPLIVGARSRVRDERAVLAAMATGALLYLAHLALGFERFFEPLVDASLPLPVALSSALASLIVLLAVRHMPRR